MVLRQDAADDRVAMARVKTVDTGPPARRRVRELHASGINALHPDVLSYEIVVGVEQQRGQQPATDAGSDRDDGDKHAQADQDPRARGHAASPSRSDLHDDKHEQQRAEDHADRG